MKNVKKYENFLNEELDLFGLKAKKERQDAATRGNYFDKEEYLINYEIELDKNYIVDFDINNIKDVYLGDGASEIGYTDSELYKILLEDNIIINFWRIFSDYKDDDAKLYHKEKLDKTYIKVIDNYTNKTLLNKEISDNAFNKLLTLFNEFNVENSGEKWYNKK